MTAILRDAGYRSDDLSADYSDGARWLSYTFHGTAHPT